jgi:hypothetical protein
MFGSGANGLVNAVAGGWQVNSIFQVHGGFPITAQASDVSGTTSAFPRADCTGSPRETPYMKSTIPGSPGYLCLDPTSVSQPALGTFGNCQVSSFAGPGRQALDLGLSKNFSFTERQSLQFRAEAINAFNHPILVAPNSRIGNTFGLVNNAQGERNIQFALKYLF